ncbi:MAG: tRNA (N(6)-L-threonylcarbamoyladenosine(37)-C(2))-methylthiotransferase MtaB [Solobacterium sp.]|nr:tRNA (N(6)-L-threonylcarbamoyladenosine(37)-C(2))-methylthiotransferase MtaB [Solobacterium sp.]
MKFSICNLGCKVNAYEAESIASQLSERGWQRVPFGEYADAALIFTCAVTNTAASKSRKMMHRAKKTNPACVTAMVGCYAEINDGRLDEAELIIGTQYKKNTADLLENYFRDRQPVRAFSTEAALPFDDLITSSFESRTRAYLKIQDGCNQFCTYCVIPYARGRERSMDPDLAVKTAASIAKTHSEIVLTGIHTGRYGREHGVSLASLMRRILSEVPQLQRLRISSIEMNEVNDELIALMREDARVARHLHIPLQSGEDEVLRQMGRPYDTEMYYSRLCEIREQLPDAAVSCDLIVGFPGESDEQFEKTCAFIRKCGFSFLHVFPYSARTGTKAAAMKGQVPPLVKKERVGRCLAIRDELHRAYCMSKAGSEAAVIAEENDGIYTKGYTSDYIPVSIKGIYGHGVSVRVRLLTYEDGRMIAERIENETD